MTRTNIECKTDQKSNILKGDDRKQRHKHRHTEGRTKNRMTNKQTDRQKNKMTRTHIE